jgi:hypothetical protein
MFQITAFSKTMACALSLMVLASCATTNSPSSPSRFNPATGIEVKAPGSHFPVLARVGGCKIVSRSGQLLLSAPTNDRSLVQTREEYRPPFALRVRGKTDTTNIRLYYSAGMVIFNWELRPSELRFHDPLYDRITSFPGKGAIEPDKFHDIAWEIYPDGTRLLVDGKEIMRKNGAYGELMAPVGIGPAVGSVITVESFSVEELQGTLEQTRWPTDGSTGVVGRSMNHD